MNHNVIVTVLLQNRSHLCACISNNIMTEIRENFVQAISTFPFNINDLDIDITITVWNPLISGAVFGWLSGRLRFFKARLNSELRQIIIKNNCIGFHASLTALLK